MRGIKYHLFSMERQDKPLRIPMAMRRTGAKLADASDIERRLSCAITLEMVKTQRYGGMSLADMLAMDGLTTLGRHYIRVIPWLEHPLL